MAEATLLPNGRQQFIDSNGQPLVGGFVYFYIPGTTTLKTTWQDQYETIPNTNPIVLDSLGSAVIFGSGEYRQVLTDSLGNLIWDELIWDIYALITTTDVTFTGNDTFNGNNVYNGNNLYTAVNNFTGTTYAVTQAPGDDTNKVATDAFVQAALQQFQISLPVGIVIPFAGATVPTGWIFCFGQSLSTSTYATLFNVIGYAFGGSGVNFNVPDLRGRVVAGIDNMGGIAASRLTTATMTPDALTLGGNGGSELITLNISQMPAHTHQYGETSATGSGGLAAGEGAKIITATTTSTGGGNSHINVQPTIMLNYIIYTGNGGGTTSPVYDMVQFYPGLPADDVVLANLIMVRSIAFAANFPGGYASALIAATADTVLTIKKNGSSVGTITFPSGMTVGTFASSGPLNLAAGDVLSIVNQATADASLANISVSMTGNET